MRVEHSNEIGPLVLAFFIGLITIIWLLKKILNKVENGKELRDLVDEDPRETMLNFKGNDDGESSSSYEDDDGSFSVEKVPETPQNTPQRWSSPRRSKRLSDKHSENSEETRRKSKRLSEKK